MDDQWTWMTKDGQVFEDVDVQAVEGGEIIFRHRDGTARLPTASLSAGSRLKFERGLDANGILAPKVGLPGNTISAEKVVVLPQGRD